MENKIKPVNVEDRIHPEFKEAFKNVPKGISALEEEKISERRQIIDGAVAFLPKYPDNNLNVSTRNIPGPEGAPEIFIKIFKPKETDGTTKLPGLLWLHGGGYLFGNADASGYWPLLLADQVKCVTISITYRLAPEHPYPAGLEDCYATLVWMAQAAEELGVDVDRIAIGGESAGGGLAAALALLARDRKGPKICFQMPLSPMLDDRNITPSSYEIIDERCWNRETNILAWGMYLKSLKDKEIPIYASPARAEDLSNLPPTFTLVGDLDVFRDETINYAQKLMQSGVPVELHVYPGCAHGFEYFAAVEFVQKIFETGVNALKSAVNPSQTK